jgi:hypothetical protein
LLPKCHIGDLFTVSVCLSVFKNYSRSEIVLKNNLNFFQKIESKSGIRNLVCGEKRKNAGSWILDLIVAFSMEFKIQDTPSGTRFTRYIPPNKCIKIARSQFLGPGSSRKMQRNIAGETGRLMATNGNFVPRP